VFFSILNRTIFTELLKVFALALLAITGILMLAGILAEASKEGLGPHQILAIVPLIIPSTLPYTIPATTLFATCVVYGRLAADNEILAIKAAGVNMLRVVYPGLLLGAVMSGVTFGLYYEVIPGTHQLMRTLFLSDVEGLMYSMLQKDGYFKHQRVDYEIHVMRVQGRKLIDAQFMHRDATGLSYDVIARAKEAELLWDGKNNQILIHMRHCRIISEKGIAYVTEKVWPVELPADFFKNNRLRVSDMTWPELLEERERATEKLEKLEAQLAARTAQKALSKPPENVQALLDELRAATRQRQQELRDIHVQLQMRPAMAVGCLCFALIGCPVAVWFGRSDFLSAFVTCFLPIVLVYYPVLLCGINLSKVGKVDAAVGMWAADAVVALVALPLYRRLLKN
jgi:lipopolysaccharide export system permease protein